MAEVWIKIKDVNIVTSPHYFFLVSFFGGVKDFTNLLVQTDCTDLVCDAWRVGAGAG